MAPELFLGREATTRSDVYAFAAVVFEALTGRPVAAGRRLPDLFQQALSGAIPRPSSLRPGLPEEVDRLLLHALDREPMSRPASIGAWAVRLADLLAAIHEDAGPSDGGPSWPCEELALQGEGLPPTAAVRMDGGLP
jgi:serine/threonine-protein kinase